MDPGDGGGERDTHPRFVRGGLYADDAPALEGHPRDPWHRRREPGSLPDRGVPDPRVRLGLERFGWAVQPRRPHDREPGMSCHRHRRSPAQGVHVPVRSAGPPGRTSRGHRCREPGEQPRLRSRTGGSRRLSRCDPSRRVGSCRSRDRRVGGAPGSEVRDPRLDGRCRGDQPGPRPARPDRGSERAGDGRGSRLPARTCERSATRPRARTSFSS